MPAGYIMTVRSRSLWQYKMFFPVRHGYTTSCMGARTSIVPPLPLCHLAVETNTTRYLMAPQQCCGALAGANSTGQELQPYSDISGTGVSARKRRHSFVLTTFPVRRRRLTALGPRHCCCGRQYGSASPGWQLLGVLRPDGEPIQDQTR